MGVGNDLVRVISGLLLVVAERPDRLRLLNLPKIGAPVASALAASAFRSPSLGVFDLVLAVA